MVMIYLFVCSRRLVVAYPMASDSHTPRYVEGACSLPLAQSTDRDEHCFRHNTYMYILYLKYEDAILAILCMGLPIITYHYC